MLILACMGMWGHGYVGSDTTTELASIRPSNRSSEINFAGFLFIHMNDTSVPRRNIIAGI